MPESTSEIEKLKRMTLLARKAGNQRLELQALRQLKAIHGPEGRISDIPSGPNIEEKAEKAAVNAAPDYQSGLIFLGRGFDNLMKGSERIALKGMEQLGGVNPLLPMLGRFGQEEIAEQREMEDRVYEPLADKYGASSTLGEIAGETAPFLNLPIMRVESLPGRVGEFASRTFLGAPLRASPEAVVGGVEGALPYQGPDDDLASRGAESGAGAAVGRLATDYLARRANVRRGRLDDDIQEFHNLGKEYDVPVRRGELEDQLDAARRATGERASERGTAALAQEVTSDFTRQMANREGNFRKWREAIFENVDTMADTAPIRRMADTMHKAEKSRGTMADSGIMKEYSRWANMPENVSVKELHQFREDLRGRIRSDGPRADQWAEFEERVSDSIYRAADKLSPGMGDALKNMDNWYYTDLERIRKMPGVRGALSENPTPQNFLNWLITKPDAQKMDVFNALSDSGKKAVREAMWNHAFRVGARGREFNPLGYAKYVESNLETARQLMPDDEVRAFENLGKLMRHIDSRGKTADNHMLRLLRGFPFMYRAVTDAVRRSNFRYLMSHAPPDIRPGSPAMERFYRGVIRALMVQGEGELEAYPQMMGEAVDEGKPLVRDLSEGSIGRLMAPSTN